MSSQLRDLGTARTGQQTAGRHEGPAASHPRGMGFSVLSRIARTRSDEADDYAPRHRLDAGNDVAMDSGAI
jgi:hypothetical protein